MGEPDFSKLAPKRLVTMSMADKYMAVCFIYDGKQYQNLCKVQNPDGTFNYSENCLSKLPSRFPFIGFETNASIQTEQALIRHTPQQPTEIPDILDFITYYWFYLGLLCILSALILPYLYHSIGRPLLNRFYPQQPPPPPPTTNGSYRYENGIISIGRISFDSRNLLGLGSKGTCVYKGRYENTTECAVKRVVSQYLTLADREVRVLRSLQHPHLVRYLATETDAQFVYIALELAEFTLGDLVETNRTDEIGLSKEELCRQAALGLQHLHKLDIVHRDIKPQNILISFPARVGNQRKVMISDLGLGKQLGDPDTIHASSTMRSIDGTQGWMAPEIVSARASEDRILLPTKSADIFSLGCVFYYIISDGQHPFGQLAQRQDNILRNCSVLDRFDVNERNCLNVPDDRAAMAKKLIKSMIQPQPDERPPISTILKYPFFWSSAYQLQFLQDVSARLESEDSRSKVVRRIERGKNIIFGFDWAECLSQELRDDLRTRRKYEPKSVRHLLRAIRNKRNHYMELSQEMKDHLGEIPDGFMSYFSSRFPELITHMYEAMQECRDEAIIRDYYEQSENFEFNKSLFIFNSK